jgi:hypothetical protein
MADSGDDPGTGTAWRRYIGGLGRPATARGSRLRGGQTTGTAGPRRLTSLAKIFRPTCTSGTRLRAKHPGIGGRHSRQKRAGRVVEAPPAHAHSGGGGGTPAPRRAWAQYSSARAPRSSPCPHAPWRFWGVDGTHTIDSYDPADGDDIRDPEQSRRLSELFDELAARRGVPCFATSSWA